MVAECTCSALRMAARRLTQVYDAALASEGINTSQYALLSRLADWRGEAPSVRQLAARLGLDRTTLTHNLRPLERDGFVAVTPDPCDRRARRISPTPKGLAKRDACVPLWRDAQQGFDVSFGADRAAALMTALRSIVQIPLSPASAGRRQETSDAV